jgi:translation elongation factor EF-1beta
MGKVIPVDKDINPDEIVKALQAQGVNVTSADQLEIHDIGGAIVVSLKKG